MPTGTQQTIQGLVCDLCELVIQRPGDYMDGWCAGCEAYIRTCNTCQSEYIDSSEANMSFVRRAMSLHINPSMFFATEDTYELVCDSCVYSCPHCDTLYEYSNSADDCCAESRGNEDIHSYCYKPRYIFYKIQDGGVDTRDQAEPGLLYMGIELEINKMEDLVSDFLINCDVEQRGFLYFKEDGSLGPEGVELVTMPSTIDAFEKIFPFDALDEAREDGARSFYYANCGFHIHVSRSSFTPSHMWKFIRFQLKNPYLCQRVAQRDESSYASWHFDDSEKRSLPEYVKGTKTNGRRYLAINFQNYATVELRYFKGNILRSAIMKNIEFVQSIYDYTKSMTVRQVMAGALEQYDYHLWLSTQNKYPNLVNFLNNNSNEGDS